MKRHISSIIATLLLISLCGCGNSINNISEQHYNYGMKALEIIDQYLDYKTTADDAASALNELLKREDELPETEFGDNDHANNYHVEINTYLICREIERQSYSADAETFESIKEMRNSIASALGEKER